jgi:hypothetical protein
MNLKTESEYQIRARLAGKTYQEAVADDYVDQKEKSKRTVRAVAVETGEVLWEADE